MLTKEQVKKIKTKIFFNKLNNIYPQTNQELCDMLGFSRQALYYVSNKKVNMAIVEKKVIDWLEEN